jgi:hypothetical protein
MEKKAAKVKKLSFEKQYAELMKGYVAPVGIQSWLNNPQWGRPTDHITKYSIYPESPNSIASNGTISLVE